MKPGRKARNVVSGLGQFFQPVVDIDKNLSDVLEAVAGVFLSKAVDLFFGGFKSKDIHQVLVELYEVFDFCAVEEAAHYYENWQY